MRRIGVQLGKSPPVTRIDRAPASSARHPAVMVRLASQQRLSRIPSSSVSWRVYALRRWTYGFFARAFGQPDAALAAHRACEQDASAEVYPYSETMGARNGQGIRLTN